MIVVQKKRYILSLVILTFFFTDIKTQELPNPYLPQLTPDRVILNVTPDPSVSIAVTWRTSTEVNKGYLEILPVTANPYEISTAEKFEAMSTVFQLNGISAYYHTLAIPNLDPDTKYMYRVGNEPYWSEWFHFKTAGKPGTKVSLIYFGDVQVGMRSLWPRVIRQAYAMMPEANAILYAGDIVNRGDNDHEWGEWFYGGSFIHAVVPGIMTPGNHEYSQTKDGQLSVLWKPQFNLPANGPELECLKETVYFTDIQDVRVVSLNSYMARTGTQELDSQLNWLDSVLQHNPCKWTCLIFHHPLYSISKTRDNSWLREKFEPLIDKYKVDLVLQGHDHAYARGRKKLTDGNGSVTSGAMYVVSVSGSKMYAEHQKDWMDKHGGNNQLFQFIEIEGNVLSYKCYTAAGELYDSFELFK